MHAKKLAATLQAADAGVNPILIRVETKAGHGGGKPISKVIEENADVYAFLFKVLDGQFTCLSQPDNAGRVLGPPSASHFLVTSYDERGELDPFSQIEDPDALGRMHLVS